LCPGFVGKLEEKEDSGKKIFEIFFFPVSACAGKKENNAKTTLFRVVFFLKKMKSNLGVTQKWVMTVAPLFTMLTEQRLCIVGL